MQNFNQCHCYLIILGKVINSDFWTQGDWIVIYSTKNSMGCIRKKWLLLAVFTVGTLFPWHYRIRCSCKTLLGINVSISLFRAEIYDLYRFFEDYKEATEIVPESNLWIKVYIFFNFIIFAPFNVAVMFLMLPHLEIFYVILVGLQYMRIKICNNLARQKFE